MSLLGLQLFVKYSSADCCALPFVCIGYAIVSHACALMKEPRESDAVASQVYCMLVSPPLVKIDMKFHVRLTWHIQNRQPQSQCSGEVRIASTIGTLRQTAGESTGSYPKSPGR